MWNQDGSNPFFDDPRVRRAMVLRAGPRARSSPASCTVSRGRGPRPTTRTRSGPTRRSSPWPYDPERGRAGCWTRPDGGTATATACGTGTAAVPLHADDPGLDPAAQRPHRRLAAAVLGRDRRRRRDRQARVAGLPRAAQRTASSRPPRFSLTFTASPDHFELYHSSAREGGYNFYGLADPEVDRLLEEGAQPSISIERREIYRRLQRAAARARTADLPVLLLLAGAPRPAPARRGRLAAGLLAHHPRAPGLALERGPGRGTDRCSAPWLAAWSRER